MSVAGSALPFGMQMTWWRTIILLASLMFIGTATLTPGNSFPSGALPPDFWCFACGNEGAADIALNVALFVPLGFALALSGLSPARALMVGLLLSAAIECAQHFGVPPNRIASATDIGTNAAGTLLGALLGAYRTMLVRPTPRGARMLTIVSMVKVVAFLSFTAWALGPDLEREPAGDMPLALQISKAPFTPGYGWFHGEINSVTVGGQTFTHEGDGPVILHGVVSQQLSGFVQLFGSDDRDGFVPVLYVHDRRIARPELMLGEQGADAVMHVSLRGQRWKFPSPSLPLRGAFRRPLGESQTLRFSITPARWTLVSLNSVGSLQSALPITLSLGWTLLQTVVHVGDRIGIAVTIVWLGLLFLPIGYWITLCARDRTVFLATTGYAFLVLTLLLIPRLYGIAKCTSLDWVSAISGMTVGVLLAKLLRRSDSPQSSDRLAHS